MPTPPHAWFHTLARSTIALTLLVVVAGCGGPLFDVFDGFNVFDTTSGDGNIGEWLCLLMGGSLLSFSFFVAFLDFEKEKEGFQFFVAVQPGCNG